MICPCEKKGDTSVVDSRPTEDGTAIRRRRLCICGERFTTFERIQLRDLVVIKNNEQKEIFDRDKMFRSISLALRKRTVDQDKMEKIGKRRVNVDNKAGTISKELWTSIDKAIKTHIKTKIVVNGEED